ncbi:hypothetical protein [Levilactobacillus wangkuiensis]|uniref:hypothetical protein n=1 Tax=Levilactobacillus wangkuiensis TaxID=2799566 RepID=UPI001942BB55|nr:hypothetical protein [Levilactobacillus wangkuiensis]
MKYAEFKEIALSEGFEPHVAPAEIVMFEDMGRWVVTISKDKCSYCVRSFYWKQVSPEFAAAIAEFAGTNWIDREMPDDEEDPE